MERADEQPSDSRPIRRNFPQSLPIVRLALGGLCVSIYLMMYPRHFAENCEFDVSTRWLREVNYSDLLVANLAWLVPALPLLSLGRKTYVKIVYCTVSLLFLFSVLSIVLDDLTGYVNCYKRLGAGAMAVGLLQLLQAAILLLFSLLVGMVAFVRRFFDRRSATA